MDDIRNKDATIEEIVGKPAAPKIEPRFAIESLPDNYVKVTLVLERPPQRNVMPDQEARGMMAMPRCMWFMTAIVRGYALQYKKPMIARAMEAMEKRAREDFDKQLKTKAEWDRKNGTDV